MTVSFVISEKQVFTMCAINIFPYLHGYLNGGQGFVIVDFMLNVQLL
jgi:hypothetical protein